MTTILGAAASGMQHHAQVIDAVAHNLANVNTAAFKKTRALNEGAPSTTAEPGSPRMGVALTALDVIPAQGAVQQTGDPLHFALQDGSYFRVRDFDGSLAYTRLGALGVDGAGNVLAYGGRFLEPPITLPTGSRQPAIDEFGVVTAIDTDGARQEVGRVGLVRFTNPQGLEETGDGLYRESANSGALTEGTPGADGFSTLLTGVLEGSNVDIAEEFTTMLIAQRAYQASAKTFSVGDQMLAIATNLTA